MPVAAAGEEAKRAGRVAAAVSLNGGFALPADASDDTSAVALGGDEAATAAPAGGSRSAGASLVDVEPEVARARARAAITAAVRCAIAPFNADSSAVRSKGAVRHAVRVPP